MRAWHRSVMCVFFFQAEDGIRDFHVTGVQTCALPISKDRVTQTHQGFGFVEFISEEDAEYAARIMNQIRLFGKPIRVNKASADKIGRASCRERVQISGDAVSRKGKKEKQDEAREAQQT